MVQFVIVVDLLKDADRMANSVDLSSLFPRL